MRISHKRIEKIIQEKAGSMTDREFFTSSAYAEYLMDIAETISGRYWRPMPVRVCWDDSPHAFAADTDNKRIRINAANPITSAMKTRPLRALSVIGFLAHELGHVLYTDFPTYRQYQMDLKLGKLSFAPSGIAPEWEGALREVKEALNASDPAAVETVMEAAHRINNILEDAYIEWRVCEEYPGKFRSGILLNNAKNLEYLPPVQKQFEDGNAPFAILLNLLIQHYKNGGIKEQDGYEGEFREVMDDCIPVFESARYDADVNRRLQAVNWLLVRLWPYIRETVEYTRQEMAAKRSLEKILEEALKKLLWGLLPSAKTPEGDSAPVAIACPSGCSKELEDAREDMKRICAAPESEDNGELQEVEKETERLFREVVRECAVRESEEELAKELQKEADQLDFGKLNQNVTVKVHRMAAVSDRLTEKYRQVFPALKPISKRLQSSVSRLLKDQRDGGKLTGLLMGKRLDSHTLYRQDGRNFYNLRLPEETELAVAVLVDESGSMSIDGRWEHARNAALLLYDFCTSLRLPVLVYGHDNLCQVTNLYAYAEFDSVDGCDRSRIMDIHDRNDNRDGTALRYVAERLLKCPEAKKLLILISDGRPMAPGYSGAKAEEDLQNIKKEYTRKGITLFAAAIGSDKETIQRIYGDGFLDISDLNALPLNLSKLVAKFMI